MAMMRNFLSPNHFIQGVVLHAGDKIDFVGTPSTPEPIVRIAPVIHDDGSGREMELPGDFDIGHLPLGDPGKFGKVTVMVQKQMKFDRPLGPSEMSPVKHAQTQIDGGRVETDQFVLEPELLSLVLFCRTVQAVGRRSVDKVARADGHWHRPRRIGSGPRCPSA